MYFIYYRKSPLLKPACSSGHPSVFKAWILPFSLYPSKMVCASRVMGEFSAISSEFEFFLRKLTQYNFAGKTSKLQLQQEMIVTFRSSGDSKFNLSKAYRKCVLMYQCTSKKSHSIPNPDDTMSCHA